MSPLIIIISILGYFSLLMMIAWYTSRNANNDSYFLGNKSSPWYAVAFGMIGDSLSGVTFIPYQVPLILVSFPICKWYWGIW
jgi:Na+/proline symporter